METAYTDALSPGPSTNASHASERSRQEALSPGPLTGGSTKSGKGRAIDAYISSVEEARKAAREERAQSRRRNESRKRGESRSGRASSRMRDPSETRGRNVKYIKPAKRSPSSPVPMSPEEIASHSQKVEPATTDDEDFYKMAITSPTDSHRSGRSNRRSAEKPERRPSDEKAALIAGLAPLQVVDQRGRSHSRDVAPGPRSPSLPLLLSSKRFGEEEEETKSDGRAGFRMRARSSSRPAEGNIQSRRAASRTGTRERSTSRKPKAREDDLGMTASNLSTSSVSQNPASYNPSESSASVASNTRARTLSRKELAAQELEARRRSLARRPSAPAIPLPEHLTAARPGIGNRSHTELGDSPTSYMPPMSRSHTVDPEAMMRYNNQSKVTGTSTPSAPIGLPATPRAMRHPRYMSTDPNERDAEPPVPRIPGQYSELSSLGSSLSQVTGSALSQTESSVLSSDQQRSMLSSNQQSTLSSQQPSTLSEGSDAVGPLLPSTVFGQKPPQDVLSRSVSAPPEKHSMVHPLYKAGLPSSTRRMSASRGHVRKISPPDLGSQQMDAPASIDAALAYDDNQVIIIPEMAAPPMLPELQHLAGPPPPPPPPTMFQSPIQTNSSGVIDIAIDAGNPVLDAQGPTQFPMPMERAQTTSPSQHRKNAPSGSGDTFSSRIRGFGDRMRSTSKSRAKSPPMGQAQPAPYESVLPPISDYHGGHGRKPSITERAKSPYEQAMAAQSQDQIPIPPPPPPAPYETKLTETAIPPYTLPSRSQSSTGYRHPKEIRANMPPEYLQQGVYPGGQGGMI